MSYREQPLSASTCLLQKVSWVFVGLGAAAIVLTALGQIRAALISQSYGIRVGWIGLALTLFTFSVFEVIAVVAANARHYGVSIWFAAFVVIPLGILLLFQLAQVGM